MALVFSKIFIPGPSRPSYFQAKLQKCDFTEGCELLLIYPQTILSPCSSHKRNQSGKRTRICLKFLSLASILSSLLAK